MRYYKKANVTARTINCLMRLAGKYFQSLAWFYQCCTVVDLNRELAFQHIKELARPDVKMALLLCARRHAFLDDTEFPATHKMPAIADAAPYIVLSIRDAYWFAHSGIFPCFFGGFLSRLPSSISSAAISSRRVSCGKITAST